MKTLVPYFWLTLAMVLVGSSVVAGEILIRYFPVYLGSLLRFALAAGIIVPVWLLQEGRLPSLSRRTWGVLAGQALCGSVLFTILLLYGLKQTSAGAAGIITSTTPACMALLAWPLLGEKPAPRVLCGILLSVAGIAIVNLAGAPDGHPSSWLGNLMVVGAVVVESCFLLVRRSIREQLSPLAVSCLITVMAMVYFLPLGLPQAMDFDMASVPVQGWLCVVYYALVVTILAYLCWFAGLTRVRPGEAGIFTSVLPVSALVLSHLYLGQPIQPQHVLGCLLALGSIALICRVPVESPDIASAGSGK